MPWTRLDLAQIRAAARAAADALGGLPVEVHRYAEDHVACFYLVPAEVARREDAAGDFDERLAGQGLDPAAPLCVQIDFMVYPWESDLGLEASCEFFFDTACSQNGVCNGAASSIVAEIDSFFGVEWEPD
jgi:hypothetical protein